MTLSRHLLAIALVCLTAVAGAAFGVFEVIDRELWDVRFSAASRPASGEIVLIEVGPGDIARLQSISAIRTMYASAIDAVLDAGATDIVVETRLDRENGGSGDALLAQALARGEGKVRTVAYAPPRNGPGTETPAYLPAPERFAALAPPVITATFSDADGVVRRYHTGGRVEGMPVPSLAAALSPGTVPAGDRFAIDFSIDAASIPTLAIREVLDERTDLGVLSGKRVIIGLRGGAMQVSVLVPRFGVLPGSLVQVLAAETLVQDRVLSELGLWPQIAIIAIAGLCLGFVSHRKGLLATILGCALYALVLEAVVMALHVHAGVHLDTASVHIALIGILIIALARELERRDLSRTSAARERDSMRGILSRVVSDNFDGVVVVDHRHRIRAASRFACEMMGCDLVERQAEAVLPAAFVSVLLGALAHGRTVEDAAEVSITLDTDDERIIEYVVTTSDVALDEVSQESVGPVACLTFRDVTERRRSEARLTYLARHDAQTGALSRTALMDIAANLIASPPAQARGISVFLIGIERLKVVNDTLGHAYGDLLLQQIVGRLQCMGVASVARLEGNCFCVLRRGLLADEAQHTFAQTIIAEVSRPYRIGGHHAVVGASVGMTDTSLSGAEPAIMIRHASMALSAAEDRPGNAAVRFALEMTERIKNKQDMEVALRAALARDEFSVHYQTQVDLQSGAVVGVEALVRWTHPELGPISPAEFIPAAEETGLIIALGRWILKTACLEVAGWSRPVRLSINVSPMQFEYGDIVADVRDALESSGLAPDRLDIEITEGLLIAETGPINDMLATLRKDGVRVALDDFGTGYSSLSYLGRLPVDTIKIDQSFVKGLPGDSEARAIIGAVLMLSESLGKDVIAEGIETAAQARMLRLAGCRTGQGYYFGRPVPAQAARAAIVALEDLRSGVTQADQLAP